MRLLTTLALSSAVMMQLMAKEVSVEQLFSVALVKAKITTQSKAMNNYGYVKMDESRMYDIAPRFGGFVEKLYADKIYQKVKKGDPLVTLYSPEVYKAKDEYLNALNYNKSRPNKGMLKSAKIKLELLGVAQKEIDAINKSATIDPYTTIYAPTDGYIFTKNITNGSAFSAKKTLFEIVNLNKVWVEAKVFEEQRADLDAIKTFNLTFKGVDKTFSGKKVLLYPNVDPKVATLTLRLEVENEKNMLFPGMYSSITMLKETKKVLTLPSTAVIRKNGKYYVFLAGEFEGEYEPIEVQAKAIDANTYAIESGLEAGDEVVNNALFMIDSDAQINGLY